MEDKKKHVNGHAERNKKPPVPNIKVSKPNSTSKTRDKLHETIGKPDNNKATLTVAPAARSRSRDKHSERLSKSAPDNNRASNTVNSSSKSRDKQNDSSKPTTKDTLQNDKSESKETKEKTNVNSTNNDKSTKQNDTKSDAPPAGRMRRAASIDVGELGRKKKTKRKKIKVDQETLLAEHTASKENLGQVLTQRSGSLGNRPNSLKLQNNANAVFPTPDPVKRHSTPVTSQRDRKLSTTSNSLSPDIPSKDTSAILPNQSKLKLSKWRKSDAETVEFSDTDDSWYSTFSSHQGYRKHGLKYTFPNAPYSRIPLPVIRKRWLNFIISIVYAIFAVVLFCPFAAFFIVLFPLCVFLKQFLKCCCSCCTVQTQGCCVCGQSLSVTEKFWVHTERQSPQVVQSLVIVEFGLSVSQVVNLVNNRVVLAKAEDGSSLYPKFSQRVVQTCSDFIWQEDQRFFIHNHVFEMPRGLESLEELQDYISDMASKPLPFDRPLWEVHILTDFGDVRDTVLLFRMHPCLVDGVSMVKILYKSIADVEPVTTVPPKVGKQNCIDSIKSIFNGPIKLFSLLLLPRNDFNLLHGEHVQLSGKKVITWSEPFSLSSAVKIKQVTRSTLNEVFMSVAAGSIRNYMIVNGVQNPFDIQSSIPVYYGANKHASGVGNDVLMMKVTLPTNTEGVVPRLWQMKQQMDQIRESSMFAITRRIFKVSYHILSESLWNRLWIYILRKCTCIVSSLPGPEIKLRMSSKQIKTIFYWFPPVRQVALAISFFTYGDQIQMAVSSDQAMLPNPDLLTKDFVFQVCSIELSL
ncbi:hypothetical protein DPMN_050234 [Dreissena polymorpha]|uniref:Diacylglycerol O-acyltransferase n=1 Tax=Dreissena polymorpha TaxID=45954 RepID=A0A9D4CH34_DREPO|nr:hypothetical protein DPMN_050234 [Dreissena polymorpha]